MSPTKIVRQARKVPGSEQPDGTAQRVVYNEFECDCESPAGDCVCDERIPIENAPWMDRGEASQDARIQSYAAAHPEQVESYPAEAVP